MDPKDWFNKRHKIEAPLIHWVDLAKSEDQILAPTHKPSDLHGNLVRIRGFVVPLEDNLLEFKEFLLVPDAMTCIHAPAPSSDQAILVRSVDSLWSDDIPSPAIVTGRLFNYPFHNGLVNADYQMEFVDIEEYNF